jgi:hypothetical protein
MAKISTYATTAPALGDMLIGTDVNDMNSTKNFTIGSLLSIPGSTTYVPYTGANANVDLGAWQLKANSIYSVLAEIEFINSITDDFEIKDQGSNFPGLKLDFNNGIYYLGDSAGFGNSTYISVDDVNQEIELSQALKVNGTVGTSGNLLISQGAGLPPTWTAPGYLTPVYGSFYDTTVQGTAGTTQELMQFNSTDLSYGVSIVNDAFGDPNEITFAQAGIYNIQFSAQLKKIGGAGATIFYIYLIKDGIAVPNSATAVTLENNGDLLVAAWNWYIDIPSTPSYCQIGWYTNNANGELHYDASPVVGIPAIPSIILTVNKIA